MGSTRNIQVERHKSRAHVRVGACEKKVMRASIIGKIRRSLTFRVVGGTRAAGVFAVERGDGTLTAGWMRA